MTVPLRTPPPRHRRFTRTLLVVLVILLASTIVNILGVWLVGDVSGWSRWIGAHSGHFAVWRGALYAWTALGWWWMRGRVLFREPTPQARVRLLRTEIVAVLATAALEITMLLQAR